MPDIWNNAAKIGYGPSTSEPSAIDTTGMRGGTAWVDWDSHDIYLWDEERWRMIHRPVGARAYRSNAHTVATATWTNMSFDREEYDTDDLFAPTGTQFIATVEGYYSASGHALWADGSDNSVRGIRVVRNGTRVLAQGARSAINGTTCSVTVDALFFYLNVGDYITFQIYQVTGGNLDTVSTGDDVDNQVRYCGVVAMIAPAYDET